MRWDSGYCKAINGTDKNARLKAFQEAANSYGVARTLQKEYDIDAGFVRLKPALDLILQPRREDFAQHRLIASIEKVRDNITGKYGGTDVLAATTKFLWLRFKRPIIIYDNNARRALKTPSGDLDKYYARWRSEYETVRAEIRSACDCLPRVHKYCFDADAATPKYIMKLVVSNEWFRERVFDTWLWNVGARRASQLQLSRTDWDS